MTSRIFCDLCDKEIEDIKELYIIKTDSEIGIIFSGINYFFNNEATLHKKCVKILIKEKKLLSEQSNKIFDSWEVDNNEKYLITQKKMDKIEKNVLKKLKNFVKKTLR
jgi:hypothetical protein